MKSEPSAAGLIAIMLRELTVKERAAVFETLSDSFCFRCGEEHAFVEVCEACRGCETCCPCRGVLGAHVERLLVKSADGLFDEERDALRRRFLALSADKRDLERALVRVTTRLAEAEGASDPERMKQGCLYCRSAT